MDMEELIESFPRNHKKYEHIFYSLQKTRKIFLTESIDSEMASAIVGNLILFDAEGSDKPIFLYINSIGGLVNGLYAIHDAIQMITAPVHTICIGEACSCAAIILASGSKGCRFATENSRILIHQLSVEGIEGKGSDIELEAEEIKKVNKLMFELLARHTGQFYNKILEDCENDKWFSAEEARSYGIIDKIIKPVKQLPRLRRKRSGNKGQ